MYLALTYDHRLLDGREAVTFLVKVLKQPLYFCTVANYVFRLRSISRTHAECYSAESFVILYWKSHIFLILHIISFMLVHCH